MQYTPSAASVNPHNAITLFISVKPAVLASILSANLRTLKNFLIEKIVNSLKKRLF